MYVCINIYIYVYICIYGNQIHFKPIHFSFYGNIKVIFEISNNILTFIFFKFHLDILQYTISIYKVCLLLNFTILLLKSISYYEQ